MASPTETTKRKLLTACGNQCAFPECNELIFDLEHETIIGDIAHIRGNKKGSARFDENLNPEKRNNFSNLIALCKKHHKIIDDNEKTYSQATISGWKKSHEEKIADLYDDNWKINAGSVSKNVNGKSVTFHYWLDKKGRPRLYSEDEYIKAHTLRQLYWFDSSLHSFLEIIDTVSDETTIKFLKEKKKELKLNEYGLMGTTFEMYQIIQDFTFLDYMKASTQGGYDMADEFRKMGEEKIAERKNKLPKNSIFKKNNK